MWSSAHKKNCIKSRGHAFRERIANLHSGLLVKVQHERRRYDYSKLQYHGYYKQNRINQSALEGHGEQSNLSIGVTIDYFIRVR